MERFTKALMIIVILLTALTAPVAFAADTVTVSENYYSDSRWSKSIRQITWTFSSDDGTIAATAPLPAVSGTLVGFWYKPGGTNTPDAAADISVISGSTSTVNLLNAICDNVGATETRPAQADFKIRTLVNDTLYFVAGSLGAGTNDGILTIFVELP